MNERREIDLAIKRATIKALGAVIIGTIAFGGAIHAPISLFLSAHAQNNAVTKGLVLPKLNAVHGKTLFIAKECVVCHSVNGVGGQDGAPLDASTMDPAMNPFEFFARMLMGMEPMLAMQQERLGHTIELTAEELGDIVAFIHDKTVQKTLSTKDIPEKTKRLMQN